jgi:hypothetical protein
MTKWIYGLVFSLLISPSWSDTNMIDAFEQQPERRWRYFSDQVMGGLSQGQANFVKTDARFSAHLSGWVTTQNNGGFIQIRREINGSNYPDAKGVTLKIKGNGERYYLHLRTKQTQLPWHYYQASFDSSSDWQSFSIPFSSFERSGWVLGAEIDPASISSLGIVAYGKDHQADLWIDEIGFY